MHTYSYSYYIIHSVCSIHTLKVYKKLIPTANQKTSLLIPWLEWFSFLQLPVASHCSIYSSTARARAPKTHKALSLTYKGQKSFSLLCSKVYGFLNKKRQWPLDHVYKRNSIDLYIHLTFAFSDLSTALLKSDTSDFSSANEFLNSSLQALRLATAEAVRDLDVDRFLTLALLGELLLENLK